MRPTVAIGVSHGDAVDLPAFVATLDIDQIIELSVGDVVAYLRNALA